MNKGNGEYGRPAPKRKWLPQSKERRSQPASHIPFPAMLPPLPREKGRRRPSLWKRTVGKALFNHKIKKASTREHVWNARAQQVNNTPTRP